VIVDVWASRIGVVAAVSLLCLRPARVEAQLDAEHVVVHLDPCTRVDPEQFRRLFDIELHAVIDKDAGEFVAGYTTTTVSIECVSGSIQLQLEDDATGRTMSRVVDVAQVADGARGRLLVLLVTELVVASWIEVRSLGPRSTDADESAAMRETDLTEAQLTAAQPAVVRTVPEPSSVDEPNDAPQPEPTQRSQPRLANPGDVQGETVVAAPDDVRTGGVDDGGIRHGRLGLRLEGRMFSSVRRPLLGGEVVGAYRPWRAFELGLSAGLSRASFAGSLPGERTLQIALTMLSASATAQLVHATSDFELNAGVGVRGGLALMQLVASNAATPQRSGAQPWVAPIAVVGGAYRMVGDVHVRVGIELGATAGVNIALLENPDTPRARQQTVAAVRGWFGAVSLGVDWIF
jgi:hypothetical protein